MITMKSKGLFKKFNSILVILAISIISCSVIDQLSNTNQDPPTNDPAALAINEAEAEFINTIPEIILPSFDFLEGGVTFVADESIYSELLIDPNSTKAQNLSLITPNGLIWTLIIPPYAVDENVTVKMTLLENINSEALGSLQTGIILEPDGLEFNRPVTIEIKGDGLGEHPLIFNGSQDGSEFDFAIMSSIDGGGSALINHFSSIFADSLSSDEKLERSKQAASSGFKRVRDFALSFLKEDVYAPKPPAISTLCPGSESEEKKIDYELKIFIEEFSMPEEALIVMLLTAGRNDSLLNLNKNDGIEISLLLMERLLKKGNLLYKAYYPQEDYFIAVTRAGLAAERLFSLMGGNPGADSFIAKSGRWAKDIAIQKLNDLRTKHDYRVIPSLLRADREASLLGNSDASLIGDLENAMQFIIQYEVELILDMDIGEETIWTQGKADYSMLTSKSEFLQMGNGEYIDFEENFEDDLVITLDMPANYNFEVGIMNFDACEALTFDLYINKFSDYSESFTYSDGDFEWPQTEGIMVASIYSALESQIVEDLPNREGETFYKFVVPIQNLDVKTGTLVITREIPNIVITFKIDMIHTPK